MTRSLSHVTTNKTTQCCVFIFLLQYGVTKIVHHLNRVGLLINIFRIVMIFISHTVNVIISLPLTSTQNTMHKIHPVTYFQTLLKLFITKYVYSLKHINTKARYCFIWQDLIGNKSWHSQAYGMTFSCHSL